MSSRRVGVSPLVALGLGICLTTGLAGRQQAPTFRSGIDLVTVDITVIGRNGSPVSTLTADDFTVKVDGKPRSIVSVRFVAQQTAVKADESAAAPAVPSPAPPPVDAAQRRTIVLVVDRDHIPAGEGQAMLKAGADFIDGLSPTDRVGLWTLPQSSDPLRFGEPREEVKRRLRLAVGINRPVYGPWNIGRDEAIKIDRRVPGALEEVIARECERQPPSCPGEVQAQATETARDAQVRADQTLTGLRDLVDALAAVEGPKHLVIITTGPVTTLENLSSIQTLGNRASAARVTIHALQVMQMSYQASAESMRARPAEIDQSASATYQVASMTGGLAITPTSGNTAFKRLTEDLSASYILVLETAPEDRDGKLHKIDVDVKNRGFGSTVRARKSFAVTGPKPAPTAPAVPTPTMAAAPLALPEAPVGTDPGELATRLAEYSELFEQTVSGIVAEEQFVQIIQPWRGNPPGPDKEPALRWVNAGEKVPSSGPIIARRQLVSDVLLAQLKDKEWVAFRDVATVDGAAVRDRTDRVQSLFLSNAPDKTAQFQRIAMESSRYNLGDLRRDINLPTVALSLLRRTNHPRFSFKRQKDEDIDGRTCRVLAYRETQRPTLISTRNSGDVYLYGRVWIDAADGRVWRTELRYDRGTGMGGFRSYVRVDYGLLEGIPTLMPARMWEWHEGVNQLGRIGGDLTGVQGLATYSKIRRFQVSTAETVK